MEGPKVTVEPGPLKVLLRHCKCTNTHSKQKLVDSVVYYIYMSHAVYLVDLPTSIPTSKLL